MRSVNPVSMKALYGPGLAESLADRLADNNAFTAADNPEFAPAAATEIGADPLVMRLRRKRMSALRKEILTRGGYGDLAKMVSFRHDEE